MYYLRKLSKLSTIAKIKNISCIDELPADLLKQELPTTSNTLSFWKCERMDEITDTVKAILLSTTSIEKTRIIIIDDELLEKHSIKRDFSQSGRTGYSGFENLHVNFCNLTYGKIGSVFSIIKEISKDDRRVPEYSKEQVKDYIREVCQSGRLNKDNIDNHLLSDITKYKLMLV